MFKFIGRKKHFEIFEIKTIEEVPSFGEFSFRQRLNVTNRLHQKYKE